jgi:hypothetical protein
LTPPTDLPDDATEASRTAFNAYHALADKIYAHKAVFVYLHAMRNIYVDFAMTQYLIRSEIDTAMQSFIDGITIPYSWRQD